MRKGLTEVLILSVPRTLALASTQISLVALIAMASFLVSGSITVFTFAFNLQSVPLTIIGVSYAVAAFPTLSRLHARGAKDEFLQYVEAALRHMIFWAIPATIFMIVMRAQIVRIILGAGQFNWDATRLTAAALALFVISLAAQSITLLIARTYYAIGNTKKPLYYGIADITVSIVSGFLLLALFRENTFVREFVEALLRVEDVAGCRGPHARPRLCVRIDRGRHRELLLLYSRLFNSSGAYGAARRSRASPQQRSAPV